LLGFSSLHGLRGAAVDNLFVLVRAVVVGGDLVWLIHVHESLERAEIIDLTLELILINFDLVDHFTRLLLVHEALS